MTYNSDSHTLRLIQEHPGSTIRDLVKLYKDNRHYNTVRDSVERLKKAGSVYARGYSLFDKNFDHGVPLSPVEKTMTLMRVSKIYTQVETAEDAREAFRDIIAVGKFIANSSDNTKMPGLDLTVAEYVDQLRQLFSRGSLQGFMRLQLITQILLDPLYFNFFESIDSYPKQEDYDGIVETIKGQK